MKALCSALFCLFAIVAVAQRRADSTALTLWHSGQYDAANQAFKALTAQYPDNPDYRVEWGRLLLERFNRSEAASLFAEALKQKPDHAGALLGLALVAADSFDEKAVEYARKALEADPKLLEAQELLARLALEDNNDAQARAEAEKALAISPDSAQAKAILATIELLQDHKAELPADGKAYESAAHYFVLNRRYEEAIALYRKAIELQPDLWSAHSQLGINLMRLGRDEEARAELEKAYAGHYRDDATVFSLRLMDSYKNFDFIRDGDIILKLHKKEAALLKPYFAAELHRCIATYEKKYKIKLDHPVQLEVYPDHEDFSVRTMGMPGLGALGVTFGYVVAMDSPSGRRPGTFHWDSTMWHEMSHVFVLSATKHRVPRWFTEGMAVYEETAAAPDWGDRLDPGTLKAIQEKKLLPIAELDRGFVRPKYPNQVIVSYFQAGRICGFIAKNWGYDKLLDMMHDFAKLESTPDVVRKELGMSPEEFDKKFLASIDAETGKVISTFDQWRKDIAQLNEAAKAGKNDEVIRDAPKVRDEYPEYVEAGSAYEALANAYGAANRKAEAIAELERYARIGGRNPETLKKLAKLETEAGQKKEAALTLNRINWIYPVDTEYHQMLGDLDMELGNHTDAIREYRAVVAQRPVDPATTHFKLAQAYRTVNRVNEAKDELLLALEAAPGYRPAQKMLLELSK
jgi:tetratricopeptide (TPR) repeat protein